MALRATKDTYAIEVIGGVEVRRQVKAGDIIPVNWTVDDGASEEVDISKDAPSAGVRNEFSTTTPAAEAAVEADKEQESVIEEARTSEPLADTLGPDTPPDEESQPKASAKKSSGSSSSSSS